MAAETVEDATRRGGRHRARPPARRKVGAALVALLVLGGLAPSTAPVPAGALSPVEGDAAWVDAVYLDLLLRPPTPAQRDHWVGRLEAGTSRRALADALAWSRERAIVLTKAHYSRILNRAAQPVERTYWADQLEAGARPTTVASFVYGSAELYGRAGGTAADYVAFLYRDILGREPDPAGAAYWADRVEAGENRTGLARAWLLTPEATGLGAGLLFLGLLNRPPSDPERADWAGRLRRFDQRRLDAALVSSPEAYALSQQYKPATRLTAGNGHSRQPSISETGRIVAFASTATNLTPGGSPPGEDIFVLDRRTGRMRALTAGNGASNRPDLSTDGSTVVFQSLASNLVEGDDNGVMDVFQVPAAGGPITRLTDGDGASETPTTNYTGTIVTFASRATDLVEGDDNGVADVFVRTAEEGQAPTLERIDAGFAARRPMVAAYGEVLVFEVAQLPGLPPAPQGVLVKLPLEPEPELVRVGDGITFQPSISAEGHMVTYTQYDELGGRPFAQLYYARVWSGETINHRTQLRGTSRISDARISGDGGVVLVTVSDGLDPPWRDDRIRIGVPPTTAPTAFPPGSDLTFDGMVVVGSDGGQIKLHRL